jgi:SAM-dependent methyltransferase
VDWSPYYRIARTPIRIDANGIGAFDSEDPNALAIDVNGAPHQSIESIRVRRAIEPFYFEPYRVDATAPEDVLIVGAGTGGDVAIALDNGARHVDAVEIDPVLARLGRDLNPDRPYQDRRVTLHVTDGRAFLERTSQTYDMVLFALPDSLALVQGQSSLRLESYLFTVQAMREVRDHLAPDGVFAMYNYYRESWLVDRLAGTLAQAFGRAPCVETSVAAPDSGQQAGGLSMLAIGSAESNISCPVALWTVPPGGAPAPSTDDHPFVYLRTLGIPSIYLLALGLILLASVIAVRVVAGPLRGMRPWIDLFLMGAAFLLLETKSVVQFALLFGTTWFVNAFVIGGVLISVILAIAVAEHLRIRRPAAIYWVLLLTLGVAWLIPLSWYLTFPFWPRLLLATSVAFAPIFFANLVFAERFREAGDSTTAFGANLLGAMLGGVLEYAALVVGYRSLLPICASIYALAWFFSRRSWSTA